jgi:two-component system LytT family response regulator
MDALSREPSPGSDTAARSRPAGFEPPLCVRTGDRIVFVRPRDLDYAEAARNYVCLHAEGETHVLRRPLRRLLARLDPRRFVRIHRGIVVNVERIRELRPLDHGGYAVILVDGSELTMTRTHRRRLEALVGKL